MGRDCVFQGQPSTKVGAQPLRPKYLVRAWVPLRSCFNLTILIEVLLNPLADPAEPGVLNEAKLLRQS